MPGARSCSRQARSTRRRSSSSPGIGPGAHLQALGITVAHDLPGVGHNLQDHFQARSLYRCTRPITLNDRVRSPFQKALMGLEWAPVPHGSA